MHQARLICKRTCRMHKKVLLLQKSQKFIERLTLMKVMLSIALFVRLTIATVRSSSSASTSLSGKAATRAPASEARARFQTRQALTCPKIVVLLARSQVVRQLTQNKWSKANSCQVRPICAWKVRSTCMHRTLWANCRFHQVVRMSAIATVSCSSRFYRSQCPLQIWWKSKKDSSHSIHVAHSQAKLKISSK